MTIAAEQLLELISESECMKADGFDDCIIGVASRCGLGPVLVYDSDKIIKKLVDTSDMTYEEAYEYYEYNIVGSYVGKLTPLFMDLLEEGTEIDGLL